MRKQTAKAIFAAAILMLLPKASAAMEDFTETQPYSGQFTDVAASDWYQPYVAKSYQLGLLNGTDSTHFSPQSNMTNAQAVTLAARIHSIYNGKSITPVSGVNWVQPYADYARNNQLADNAVLADLNRNVSRLTFAQLMANALPESEFDALNHITAIPDMAHDSDSADAVYRLYNAGIITGSDKFGTFNPTSTINRAEVSTIVARMLDTSLRKTFTLAPRPNIVQLLKNVSYYGDISKCKMTPAMANAYADVLDSLPAERTAPYEGTVADLEAMLYDIADDGYPLLLTTYSGNVIMPVIWACQDGVNAVNVLANEDSYSQRLCKINDKTGFYTDSTPPNVGGDPAWYWFYAVQNGKVSKVYTVAEYSAAKDGTSYSGSNVPGISSEYLTEPVPFNSYKRKSASLAAFERAGWSKPDSFDTIYYYTANGEKLDMSKIQLDGANADSQLFSMVKQIGITPFPGDNTIIGSAYALVEIDRWLPYQAVWSSHGSENLMSAGLRSYANAMQ